MIKLDITNSEPLLIRRHNYVKPFSRPANIPPLDPSYDDESTFDFDFLNNVSLGELLKDDQTLIEQTENLSTQVRFSIATRLTSLASRLQHAANILLEGTNPRRRFILFPTSHRQKHRKSTPKPSLNRFNTNNESESNPNPKISSNDQVFTSTASPKIDGSIEFTGNKRKEESDKKEEEINRETLPKRAKRDLQSFDGTFGRVSKQQLTDVSNEVKTGYNNVIKLLKRYLDDPPVSTTVDRQNLKRSSERAEQLLENIEGAKKIFVQIEDYVSRQYLENDLEHRNQTDLMTYYDKIIRVEKNRIGQALNEYDTQLASNYKPVVYQPNNSKPSRPSIPEYQNDEDHDRYLNERRKEIERENRRTPIRSYYNEIPEEEKLINGRNQRPERPKILITTYYEPPKRNRRPTRISSNERIRPPYEVSVPVSNRESFGNDDDERGYEMIEP